MSDHSHYGEYTDARHGHDGDYAPDRHDHDLDYAEKYHRHYDLETDDKTAQQAITCLRVELDELRRQLDDALGRIADLERLQPTCVICLDATATQQTVHGPACSDCVGEPEERPKPEPWAPGPETGDEGGMSEYREQAIENTRKLAQGWIEQARANGQDVSAAGLALEVTREPLFSLGGP